MSGRRSLRAGRHGRPWALVVVLVLVCAVGVCGGDAAVRYWDIRNPFSVAAPSGPVVWSAASSASSSSSAGLPGSGPASPGPASPGPTSAPPTSPGPASALSAVPSPTSPAPAMATSTPRPTSPAPTVAPIDLNQYSTTDPSSLWVIVNKQHPITPITYVPKDLVWFGGAQVRRVVEPDLAAMFAAAKADGVVLGIRTGYRSYGFQESIHAGYVRSNGAAYADQYSARAGYSEHQTGLAMDLHSTSRPSCDLHTCFAQTVEAKWVAAHAWQYGFIVRYTPQNTAVTGYAPEAWHVRYIGRPLAAWMHATGATSLEQVFGVSGGASYSGS